MEGCPQDAVHHAEGDVRIHTRMVVEALSGSARVARPAAARSARSFSRPRCCTTSRSRTARGSRTGASPAAATRSAAPSWRARSSGAWTCPSRRASRSPPSSAITRCRSSSSTSRTAVACSIEVSQSARCDLLALVAEADARGRVCADAQRLLDNISLFTQYCGGARLSEPAAAVPERPQPLPLLPQRGARPGLHGVRRHASARSS